MIKTWVLTTAASATRAATVRALGKRTSHGLASVGGGGGVVNGFVGRRAFSAAALAEAPTLRRAALLEAVKEHVKTHNDAFYVVDLKEVVHKYRIWQRELPRVRPCFAVKCNDDPKIVEVLAKLGAGFDCASKGEISMALKLGVAPKDIIFAHPAKQPTHLHYAKAHGVVRMTFDNEDELRKIAREYPGAQVVLRILADDSHSVVRLGLKFGCPLGEVDRMVALSQELGVTLVGVSYHVGSGNGNAESFGDAVRDAKKAFDIAAARGVKLSLLDIGGGFPGSEMGAPEGSDRLEGTAADAHDVYATHPSFSAIAACVRRALDTHFPEGCGVDLIAEPGRFFVKSSHTLAVNVVGKRRTLDDAGASRINYYVNDGIYGSFNCVQRDHATCVPSMVLSATDAALTPVTQATVADDAIVRLAEDGTPLVADAVGLEHAKDLHEVIAPLADAVEAQQQVAVKRMVLGGSDSDGEDDAGIVAAGGAGGAAGAPTVRSVLSSVAAAAAAASPSSAGPASSGTARRAFSFASLRADAGKALHPTTIWGPTCDSIDKISDSVALPELQVGDWLVFENMGAYTVAGSCRFNGFPISSKVYMHVDGRVEVQAEEVTE